MVCDIEPTVLQFELSYSPACADLSVTINEATLNYNLTAAQIEGNDFFVDYSFSSSEGIWNETHAVAVPGTNTTVIVTDTLDYYNFFLNNTDAIVYGVDISAEIYSIGSNTTEKTVLEAFLDVVPSQTLYIDHLDILYE